MLTRALSPPPEPSARWLLGVGVVGSAPVKCKEDDAVEVFHRKGHLHLTNTSIHY